MDTKQRLREALETADDWEVQVRVQQLIGQAPEAQQSELTEGFQALRQLLASLGEVFWLAEALRKYGYCRVCGKPVDPIEFEFAMSRFEQPTCSPECAQAELVERHACCSKAKPIECVCVYAFTCPEHGERHIGSHE